MTLLIKHLLALDPIEVTITRGVIELSSVLLRSEPGEKFAHVRITEFYPNTVDQLREILQQVQRDGAEGLILEPAQQPGRSPAVRRGRGQPVPGRRPCALRAEGRRPPHRLGVSGRAARRSKSPW